MTDCPNSEAERTSKRSWATGIFIAAFYLLLWIIPAMALMDVVEVALAQYPAVNILADAVLILVLIISAVGVAYDWQNTLRKVDNDG